jgi:endonuclease/exonuclease/phosphatase family metal-dependent hydrolase
MRSLLIACVLALAWTPAASAAHRQTEAPAHDPATALADEPPELTTTRTAHFAFESDADPARIECRLDGSSWLPCPQELDLSGVAPGVHTLQARAVDAAGNRDRTPATSTWTEDLAPPAVRAVLEPSVIRARKDKDPIARIADPSGGRARILRRRGVLVEGKAVDALTHVARVYVALRRVGTCRFFDGRRGTRRRACSSPHWLTASQSGDFWAYRLRGGARVPRGTYRLLVRAVDAAGNASKTFTTRPLAATPLARLRVLTFNVAGGPGTGPGFDPAAVAAVAGGQGADVIALQEVCSWAVENLVARLTRAGYVYYAHLPAVTGIPDSRPGSPGTCDYGNAIISKLPLTRPSTRSASWLVAPPDCRSADGQAVTIECRLVTSVDVVPRGWVRPVRLNALQLGPDRDPLQDRETAEAERIATAAPEHAIVVGDLNMEPSDTRLEPLRDARYRSAGGVPTFPFTTFETPYLQIDAIFVRGRFRYHTRAINPKLCAGGGCAPISDHRALVSTLTLLP